MPTVPRGLLSPAPPNFAFPNLVPPARIIPPDFELWPEIRIGQHLVSLDLMGLDLRTITLPVTPTIPPTVATGDLITAAHENAVRQALQDLWIDIQAIAAIAAPQTPWTQDIDAAGFNLSNVGALTTNTLTATGAITAGSISSTGPLNASEAWISGAVNTALFRSTTDMVFQVGGGYPERVRIQAATGNVGIGSANPTAPLTIYSASNFPYSGLNGTLSLLHPGSPTRHLNLGIDSAINRGIIQVMNGDSGLVPMDLLLNPAGGNVGIGTTPDVTLHVAGKALARDGYFAIQGDYSLVNGAPLYGLGKSTVDVSEGAGAVAVQLAGWGGIHLCSQGGQMVMTRTGKVGIGMPNPAAKCAVFAGADGSDGIHVHGANSAGFLYLAMNNATGAASIGVWTGSAHGNVVIAPAGGSILMWLGGGLKTLSVDGSGFVKAT